MINWDSNHMIDFGWDVKHLQVSPLTMAVCH